MNAKPKSRIYSQEPRRFAANRHQSKLDKELMLVRMSSFQDGNIGAEGQLQKLANTAKNKDRFPRSPYESEGNKARAQENIEERKSKHQPKKDSEQKVKVFGISTIRKESQKHQLGVFFNDKEAEIMEAKLDIKQRKKKPRDTKKLIYFTRGNNHPILKEVFCRFNFAETQVREHAQICWLQSSSQKVTGFHSSKSLYDDHLPQIGKARTESTNVIYNYLQGQSELTNKERLYKNMKKCYPESIGNYIPTSFIIDFKQEQSQVEESLLEFIKYYLKKETKKPKSRAIAIKNYFMEIVITNKQINRLLEKAQMMDKSMTAEQTQEKPDSNEQQATLWIFKPTSLNRGRGIHLFSSLKQLSKLLSENSFEISIKVYNDNMSPKSYIIQEYIDRPLLIDGYKFDMRVWVMLNVLKVNGKKVLKAHLFKHGYSRLASVKYNFVEEREGEERQAEEKSEDKPSPKREKKAYINNKFIHLTNNAVQKDAKEYGNFCEGNQLSIEDTVDYFQQQGAQCPLTFPSLLQAMQKIVFESVSSVKERLTSSNTAKTFQLLGYDFLIDSSYKLWLIEVNCNPCLQESSQLLGRLLRSMLSGLVVLSELEEPRSQAKAEGWLEVL